MVRCCRHFSFSWVQWTNRGRIVVDFSGTLKEQFGTKRMRKRSNFSLMGSREIFQRRKCAEFLDAFENVLGYYEQMKWLQLAFWDIGREVVWGGWGRGMPQWESKLCHRLSGLSTVCRLICFYKNIVFYETLWEMKLDIIKEQHQQTYNLKLIIFSNFFIPWN